jgi:deazaflavin-dependent oxidoreductase (nitroreductase family)
VRTSTRINGRDVELDARADEPLLYALRRAGYRSVRLTCGIGVCGACTVLIDGIPMSSCLVMTPAAAGLRIETAEGLADDDPVASAFQKVNAFQCGYCTPAFVLTARALLAEVPTPTDEDIKETLAGNLCRCGSYLKIVQAIHMAAALMSEQRKPPQIPSDMKAFNQVVIAEHRANAGKLSGRMAGRTVLLLTTTGARSGQSRTTVLGYGRVGERYVVIASNNGASKSPSWYVNLLANPVATVEVGAEKFGVYASTAQPDERDELAKAVPYLEGQQKLTERQIPLVILERVSD